MFPFLFGKTFTCTAEHAMRPLPSFLLLCASYGGTAIDYGSASGHGLDYCIAEADTTSDMTASTTMAAPVCTPPWTSLAPPYMSATTWAPDVCEHNPNRADRTEQWVQSVSSSTFEPAICLDNPFHKLLSTNWQLGSEHLEDMCASPLPIALDPSTPLSTLTIRLATNSRSSPPLGLPALHTQLPSPPIRVHYECLKATGRPCLASSRAMARSY